MWGMSGGYLTRLDPASLLTSTFLQYQYEISCFIMRIKEFIVCVRQAIQCEK